MPPPNDDFANAEALVGASGSVDGDNTDATAETPDPLVDDHTNGVCTVWYAFTPEADGTLDVWTEATGGMGDFGDTVIAVYTGASLGTLSEEDYNDDAGGTHTSPGYSEIVGLAVTEATTYWIEVSGYDDSQFGTFRLSWDGPAPPLPPPDPPTKLLYGARGENSFDQGDTVTTSDLYLIDPATAVATSVGPIGYAVAAMVERNTNTLWGVTSDSSAAAPKNLIVIDKATGAGTVVGPLGTDHAAYDMAMVGGVIYAVCPSIASYQFVSIDPGTGAATVIDNFTPGADFGGGGITDKPDGTHLYYISNLNSFGTPGEMWTVATDATFVDEGAISGGYPADVGKYNNVQALTADPDNDGVIYGLATDDDATEPPNVQLAVIDARVIDSAAATLIGETTAGMKALAFASPPTAAPPNINEFSVAFAFEDGPLVVDPTWTYLDSVDGIRVQEWTISRGRPNELEKTSTGTATVTIADREGVFDPTNASSPVYPNLYPDRQAMIQLFDPVQETWHSLFRGYIEDIDIDVRSITYDSGVVEHGILFVTLRLVDAFAWLNDHELMPGLAGDTPPAGSEGRVFYEDTPGQAVGEVRIPAILSDVGWLAGLSSIFSGNVSVTETTYEPGTTALAALFDAADAEFPGVANLYVSKDGILTFHGRQARFRPDVAQYGINRRDVGDPSVTEMDDTVAPIAELEFSLGKAFLYNSVLCLPQDTTVGVPPTEAEIAAQLVEDAGSIAAHGKKGLTYTDLLTLEGLATGNTALQETAAFATYFADNFPLPFPRITRMVFKARMPDHRLADPLWKMMCRCEISDLLTVTTAHKGGGGFGEGYYVEGIRYTCRPANDRVHNVTLEVDVSPQALYTTNPFDDDPDPA